MVMSKVARWWYAVVLGDHGVSPSGQTPQGCCRCGQSREPVEHAARRTLAEQRRRIFAATAGHKPTSRRRATHDRECFNRSTTGKVTHALATAILFCRLLSDAEMWTCAWQKPGTALFFLEKECGNIQAASVVNFSVSESASEMHWLKVTAGRNRMTAYHGW